MVESFSIGLPVGVVDQASIKLNEPAERHSICFKHQHKCKRIRTDRVNISTYFGCCIFHPCFTTQAPSEMVETAPAPTQLLSEAVHSALGPTCDNVRLDISPPGCRRDDVILICEGDTCPWNHRHLLMRFVQQSQDSADLRPVQTCQSKSLVAAPADSQEKKMPADFCLSLATHFEPPVLNRAGGGRGNNEEAQVPYMLSFLSWPCRWPLTLTSDSFVCPC